MAANSRTAYYKVLRMYKQQTFITLCGVYTAAKHCSYCGR